MSHYYAIPLVDAAELAETRRVTGPGFPRIVRYFQEDGVKAIVKLEQAMHARSATAMVFPAHTLKGEARQLGAVRLGDIAETIEKTARTCIEKQLPPDAIAIEVSMLRGCFAETLQHLQPASDATGPITPTASVRTGQPGLRPLFGRSGTFGRRTS